MIFATKTKLFARMPVDVLLKGNRQITPRTHKKEETG